MKIMRKYIIGPELTLKGLLKARIDHGWAYVAAFSPTSQCSSFALGLSRKLSLSVLVIVVYGFL